MDQQDPVSMDQQDSSEEEDVFECGRCREKFDNLEGFMEHKNNRVCRKPKLKESVPVKSSDVAPVTETAMQVPGTIGEVHQNNEMSSMEEPLDMSQGSDIIRAASIASGIDNLAAAALEFQKQNEQPMARADNVISTETHQDHQPDNLVAQAPPHQQAVPQEGGNNTIAQTSQDPQLVSGEIDNSSINSQTPQDQQMPQENENDIAQETGSPKDTASVRISPISDDEEAEEDQDDSDMVEISLAAFNLNCSFCSSAFTNYVDLRQHFGSVHRISSEQIDKLVKDIERSMKKKQPVIKKQTMVKRQVMVKKTSPGRPRGRKRLPTNCELCGKVFSTRKNYLKHTRSKHHLARVQAQYIAGAQGKRLKKCSHCSFSASSGKELTDHIKKRHSQSIETEDTELMKRGRGRPRKTRPSIRYRAVMGTCPECGKQLKGKLLTMHIRRCQLKNTLEKCSECGKSVLKKALYRHQRRCINKKHLICPLCKHQSRERYDYSVHVNGHKTWIPAELGDMPPPKEEHSQDGSGEQDKGENTNQDGAPHDVINREQVSDPSQDTISTLDLSVLGLTPTPTPAAAPVDMHDQNDITNQHVPEVASMSNGEALGLLNMESSQKPTSGNFAPVDEDRNTRQTQLKCHSCDNWFQRAEFKRHMFTIHNLVKKFKCRLDNCGQAVVVIDQFVEHCKAHGDDLPFACGCRSCLIRNANTDDPEYIKELKKQKLKEYYQGMIYKCNKCWIKFPTPEGLERHNRKETHSHPCPSCGKVQVSRRQLRMHMVTHNEERNYLCEECGSSFKTQRDLTKHHMSHSDFKPFICQECGKGFLFKNKLDRHCMTVHSNEKPYKCTAPNCEKAFSRSDKLRDHSRTHLLYEPFHCRFCPKGFFRKDNLKDHEVLHTKDYRFKCDKCPKGFMRPKLLARHIAHEHGIQSTTYNDINIMSTDGPSNTAQLMPLKLTKPKLHKKPKQKRPPAPVASPQSTETQAQNLTSQITYMIYQQAGSSMAAALQQAMQSVNAGADGLPVSLPPEVLQAYHLSQHGGKVPHVQDYPPIVGAEEQINPDHLHDSRNEYVDRNDFRLA